MTHPTPPFMTGQIAAAKASCKNGWKVLLERGPSKVTFWFIALLIGIAAGFAALFFRKGISWLQTTV